MNVPARLRITTTSPAALQQAKLFQSIVAQRGGALTLTNSDDVDITLDLRADAGRNGYRIESRGASVAVIGGDDLGLLHGIGKILRTADWTDGFRLGAWRGASAPDAPLRAMYFAFNFNNWYCSAPAEDVARYALELGLYGYNTIFISVNGQNPNDRSAWEARLTRIRTIFSAIKRAGMQTGLLITPNVMPGGPREAAAVDVPDTTPARRGNVEDRVCPSHPEGLAFLHRMIDLHLAGYEDIGVDYVTTFPYDAGGCGCPKCWPWGAKAFISLSRDTATIARKRYPGCKFVLCTWCYDVRPESDGEFEALDRQLRASNGWCDYIMADSHEDFPRHPLEHGSPGGLPLVTFPEISMWGRYPWGGFGANPLPERFERLWRQVSHLAAGGFPYSEGIFEDINKIVVGGFFWRRHATATETLREYVAYEFSPAVADDAMRLITLLEKNYPRSTWRVEDVESAWSLAREIDAKLPARVRTAWRWRIVYLRALIDHELISLPGQPHSDRCDTAFEELIRIYHAQQTGGPDCPPSRAARARLTAKPVTPPPPGSEQR